MSTTKDADSRDPLVGARVPDEMKRKAEMRASQLGLNMNEYLTSLIEEDLSEATYLQNVNFE